MELKISLSEHAQRVLNLVDELRHNPVYADILKSLQGMECMLGDDEGLQLYKLAAKSEGDIVEIGSYTGRSTIWIARGSISGNGHQVISIDTHDMRGVDVGKKRDTYLEFLENMNRAVVNHVVTPVRMSSRKASEIYKEGRWIGMLFLDGDHSYEGVKEDYLMWSSRVITGGMIIFHDSTNEDGVIKFVKEVQDELLFMGQCGSLAMFTKPP